MSNTHQGFPTTLPAADNLVQQQATQTHIRTSKSGLEWPRKLFHSVTGFVTLALWSVHIQIKPLLQLLGTLLCILVAADLVRFNSTSFETWYEKRLGFLMRASEKEKINGVIWYIIAVMTCLSIFPRDIAVLSIVILSWCDTTASIFGRLFGRYTPPLPLSGTLFAPRKSLAGTGAAVLTGSMIAFVFYTYFAPLGSENDLSWSPPATSHYWTSLAASAFHKAVATDSWSRLPNPKSTASLGVICAISGLAAGLAEGIEIWHLDDNLTMAPIAGSIIYVAMLFT